MESLLLKASFVFTLIFSTNVFAQEATDCVSHGDLQEIAADFSQFSKFLGNKTEYCEAEMGIEWLKIANSLVLLKNIQPDEPAVDKDDAFTYKAISEKDWWAYFTQRAKRFSINNSCPPGVVAYVQPFFGNGTVNLCTMFFDMPVPTQSSVMMHEIRHFDGKRHVTCSQGNEQGNAGACDASITYGGSYAISIQTSVGMARSKGISKAEKPLLESEAVYMAFNKFNTVPKVKLNNTIILSNTLGEIYRWTLTKGKEGFDLIKTLTEPATVMNSANNLTIYPLDPNSEAYRKDKYLEAKVENPGLYAKHYNSESVDERATYKSISYFATGGMLKGNTLHTLCNMDSLALGEENLDSMGNFMAIINVSLDENDQKRESLLLADNGDLYRYSCRNNKSTAVDFEKTSMKMALGNSKIVDSFGFNGEQYALMDDGKLSVVSFTSNLLEIQPLSLPLANKDWISATPLSQPEVF